MTSGAVVLVAHGSADPAAAAVTGALARVTAAARPGLVARPAFLDHARPRLPEVLAALAGAGHPEATVVPVLLTAAYHDRVDLPAVLAKARAGGLRLPVHTTPVLGMVGPAPPAPLLLAALLRRLDQLRVRFDAVALAAAGTRDPAARATVATAAEALGRRLGVPCRAGYATAAAPSVAGAVLSLRATGRGRVVAAAYFLAPGRLYAAAADSARAAGAVAVGQPLGAARELAQLVLDRLDDAAAGEVPDRPPWSCPGCRSPRPAAARPG